MGCAGRAGDVAVICSDDAPAEAASADREPCAVRDGRKRDCAGQGVVAWHQPDGVAARAGALGLLPARAARRVPGRNGLGRHPPVSVLPSCRPLRLVGTVGVITGRDPCGAAIPKGCPVRLRVRPEHSVAPRGSHRGSPAVGSGQGIPGLHRRQRCLPAGGQWRTSGLHGWARWHAIAGCPRGSRNHGRDHRPGRVGSQAGSPRR